MRSKALFAAALLVAFFLGSVGAAAWHVTMVGDKCSSTTQPPSPPALQPPSAQNKMIEPGQAMPGASADESSYTGAFRGESIPQIMGDFEQSDAACGKGEEKECQFQANAQLALMDRGVCLKKNGGWEKCRDEKEKMGK